jgi:hypothetical protein
LISFGYDALNRPKSKAADPTNPSLINSHAIECIEFDYHANGSLATATAPNGLVHTSEPRPRSPARGKIPATFLPDHHAPAAT